jgi:hypothetical protein
MMTTWILWAVLTLVTPTAQVVIPVDEFAQKDSCKASLKAIAEEMAAIAPENITTVTLTCIPVGMRD